MLRNFALPKLDDRSRRWLNRAGGALGALGIVFVAYRLYLYRDGLTFDRWGIWHVVAFLALTVAYVGANLSAAIGWHALLRLLNAGQPARLSVRIYAVSQLAKYLPGNIFHFAGRQLLGAAAGIPQKILLASTFLEILLLCFAGACFLPLVLPVIFPFVGQAAAVSLFAIVIGLTATALLVLGRPNLNLAAAGYSGQVVVSNSIFLCLFLLVGGVLFDWNDMLVVAGSYTVAWLAGLLTPGAPAGLGVREAALVVLLAGNAAEPVILAAALLARFVTTSGDVLFYMALRSLGTAK